MNGKKAKALRKHTNFIVDSFGLEVKDIAYKVITIPMTGTNKPPSRKIILDPHCVRKQYKLFKARYKRLKSRGLDFPFPRPEVK
jgi:hypothetical protein